MSSKVKPAWFRACAPFLRATALATNAPVAVTLGRPAWGALASAFGREAPEWRSAVQRAARLALTPTLSAFAVFHPAARPKDRTLAEQVADWKRIAAALAQPSP